jgi:hypothetical protein
MMLRLSGRLPQLGLFGRAMVHTPIGHAAGTPFVRLIALAAWLSLS